MLPNSCMLVEEKVAEVGKHQHFLFESGSNCMKWLGVLQGLGKNYLVLVSVNYMTN